MPAEPARPGADLHAHTTFSDGTLTPTELVATAREEGLAAVAVTDHDTTAGVAEALAAAGDLLVVPGVELSCYLAGREMHLLGLFVDPDHAELVALCERQRASRHERAGVIVKRLRSVGIGIHLEMVEEIADGAPIGRPHIANALVASGVVCEMQEAFDRFIGAGRPAFAGQRSVAAAAAIETVHRAGGVAVVAHPGSSRVREARLRELAASDLDGIEVRHPRHEARREAILGETCARLGLLPSGGSDFHGPGPGNARLGQHRVPLAWCEQLRRRAAARRGAGANEEPGGE